MSKRKFQDTLIIEAGEYEVHRFPNGMILVGVEREPGQVIVFQETGYISFPNRKEFADVYPQAAESINKRSRND